jgi:hypothetical protein
MPFALPAEVWERLVGVGHAVHVLTLCHRGTLALGGGTTDMMASPT